MRLDRPDAWLAQAGRIFTLLEIKSEYQDYGLSYNYSRDISCNLVLKVVVDSIDLWLALSPAPENPPKGYLFVCPAQHLQSGQYSFRSPECPAYWSLDPAGVERLSTEEATRIGLPRIQFDMRVHGRFWDASVYDGLRQFHRAKGFNPNSEEVALQLGYPIYRVSGDLCGPFACGEKNI